MNKNFERDFHQSIADQLIADLRYERQLMDLIIRGCIEYRWAVGQEEQDIAEAIIYNAFETYAIERGIPLPEAEAFCEQHLDELIQMVQDIV